MFRAKLWENRRQSRGFSPPHPFLRDFRRLRDYGDFTLFGSSHRVPRIRGVDGRAAYLSVLDGALLVGVGDFGQTPRAGKPCAIAATAAPDSQSELGARARDDGVFRSLT